MDEMEMKVHLRYDLGGDWVALYKDGKKVIEGHRLDTKSVLSALELPYTIDDVDAENYIKWSDSEPFPKVLK